MTTNPPPPPWVPGTSRRWGILVCCPKCGNTITEVCSTQSKRTRYHRCKLCQHSWKEVHDEGRGKATVVIVA